MSVCKEVFTMWKPLIGTALMALLLVSPVLAVDLDDVFRMLEAGMGDEVILKVIDADRAEFVLTSDDLIDLKEAGASDWLLEALLDRSEKPSRAVEGSYRVIEPSYSMVTIGYVYDPFDYYFVTWPYYYAYYSPFTFCWNWWYYGGPIHRHWCDRWGSRVNYYDGRWGARTIWDRGWRGDTRYHVPRYDHGGKENGRDAGSRPVSYRSPGDGTRNGNAWTRGGRDEKPVRSGAIEPGRQGDRPARTPAWGRPERRTETPSRPARTPRGEVRTQPPTRSSTNPSNPRPQVRSAPPSRSAAPARPSTPSRSNAPSRPATPPRHAWSR
jgi:hypothetical protein